MIPPSGPSTSDGDEAATGLPALRTWRGVYLCVIASFVLWVALLTALTWRFGGFAP